jgi:hypothetical protein
VARFGEADIAKLLANAGIVRSRAKIEATIRTFKSPSHRGSSSQPDRAIRFALS